MKTLILDSDASASNLLRAKLEEIGHDVHEESAKSELVKRVIEDVYDVIFIDPSPMNGAHDHVLNIRRAVRYYPYLFLLSEGATHEMAVESGVNEFLPKPIDPVEMDEKLFQAKSLLNLVSHLNDEREDFKSGGGIISKSAFNQLFISALDRASRYGEVTYLLFISLDNYTEISQSEGASSADVCVASMCQNMMDLRRRSDIVGQTRNNEFCLLIQRPNNESEPIMAANRFAEGLVQYNNTVSSVGVPFSMSIKLYQAPTGRKVAEHYPAVTSE